MTHPQGPVKQGPCAAHATLLTMRRPPPLALALLLSLSTPVSLSACGGDKAPEINPWGEFGGSECRNYVRYMCTCHEKKKLQCKSIKKRLSGVGRTMEGECNSAMKAQKEADRLKGIKCH